jgi:signal transduction histidine kinase/ActR/RegA family two-component response regulator
MKLRTHYLWLAFSIVLPVVLFSSIALKMLLSAHRDAAIKRMEETARATALVIDADINRAQSVLRILATSNTLATGDMRRFHQQASIANAGPGAWVILYDTTGQQLINTRIPFGGPLPARPDMDQLEEMLRSGKGVVSGMKWGLSLKNHFMAVELPIVTSSGQRFVIAQAFSPSYFSKAFADRDIPPSWLVGVFDRNGTIIARSHRAEEFVGRQVKPETLQAIRSSENGMLQHVTSDGTEVYDVFTHSPLSNWAIAIGAPVTEIESVVWRGVAVAFLGLVIAIITASILAAVIGRRLVRSISRASQAAVLLGRGDKVAALGKSSITELEELNQALTGASTVLHAEKQSRLAAENERNELLIRERQARSQAEEQNRAKDEFLAMLGHELRNPLSAITSAVAVMDSNAGAGSGSRARNVLRRQTEHLRRLVDDLLDVNRVLMGKVTLDKKHVDLGEVARDCVEALQSAERTRGYEMTLEAVPSWIDADPTRIAQVVNNILDNAVKYTPAGGSIHVDVRHTEGFVRLTVRDSGIGISAELLPRVFNMFVQGEQTLQREKGGLGIGLALVRRLVEMHGGTVEIHSPGHGLGSSVTVRLPRLPGNAADTAATAAPNVRPRRKVLLVEDHQDGREMMSMMLETQNCEVFVAASGQEGIDAALSEHPEIAIIDIGLPGMDGYAVARALRKQPQTNGIRLVALTGYGTDEDRQRALDAGFDLHLTKPVTLERLRTALEVEIAGL